MMRLPTCILHLLVIVNVTRASDLRKQTLHPKRGSETLEARQAGCPSVVDIEVFQFDCAQLKGEMFDAVVPTFMCQYRCTCEKSTGWECCGAS